MTALNKQALRGQSVEGSFYLAECGHCGEMYPSNKLDGGEPLFSGDYGECFCHLCGADDSDIADNGAWGSEAVTAWNYQQKRIEALLDELEAAEKRMAELQSKSMRPVAWMRSDDITTFGPIFTKNENYAVEQWGDNAVALYASPVNFKLACFTDERNLKYINERGRETSLIWSERNSENGDVQLFRAAGIGVKGE